MCCKNVILYTWKVRREGIEKGRNKSKYWKNFAVFVRNVQSMHGEFSLSLSLSLFDFFPSKRVSKYKYICKRDFVRYQIFITLKFLCFKRHLFAYILSFLFANKIGYFFQKFTLISPYFFLEVRVINLKSNLKCNLKLREIILYFENRLWFEYVSILYGRS